MKLLQGAVLFGVTVLLGAGIVYWTRDSLSSTVQRQGEKLTEIETVNRGQGEAIQEQGERLLVSEKRVEEHAQRIEALRVEVEKAKERLTAGEAKLKEHEGRLHGAEQRLVQAEAKDSKRQDEVAKLSEEVSKLRNDEMLLRQDYEQRVQELDAFRKKLRSQDDLNREVLRRLDLLEKQSGVTPASP
jgi:chromosome segregation ATPase